MIGVTMRLPQRCSERLDGPTVPGNTPQPSTTFAAASLSLRLGSE